MSSTIKQSIVNHLRMLLDKRISESQSAIESAKESRDNETKSSVGDKYETGRAMMQYELEKSRIQLLKTEKLKLEISKINTHKEFNKIEFGSLVHTNNENYFISIGLGKVSINKEIYYCISMASPIGKNMLNKKVGDKFNFQGKETVITSIH